MNTDGSDQTNLTKDPGSDRAAQWSPDGEKVVFQADRDGDDEVYVMNSDGSAQTNLSRDPGGDESPRWNPKR